MRKYYKLKEEQSINQHTRIRKHILGGISAYVIGDPIQVEDGYEYKIITPITWKYLNYRWIKKLKKNGTIKESKK